MVAHEPKFLSENLLVFPAAGKGPRYLFLFPRSSASIVEQIVENLRERHTAPVIQGRGNPSGDRHPCLTSWEPRSSGLFVINGRARPMLTATRQCLARPGCTKKHFSLRNACPASSSCRRGGSPEISARNFAPLAMMRSKWCNSGLGIAKPARTFLTPPFASMAQKPSAEALNLMLPIAIGNCTNMLSIRRLMKRFSTFFCIRARERFFTRTSSNRNVLQVRVDLADLPQKFSTKHSAGPPRSMSGAFEEYCRKRLFAVCSIRQRNFVCTQDRSPASDDRMPRS